MRLETCEVCLIHCHLSKGFFSDLGAWFLTLPLLFMPKNFSFTHRNLCLWSLGSLQCSICMLANSTGVFNPMSITNYKTGRDSECRIPNYNSYNLGFPEAIGHGVRDCTVDGAQRRKGLPNFSLGLLYHDPGRGKSCGGHKKRRQEKTYFFKNGERIHIPYNSPI